MATIKRILVNPTRRRKAAKKRVSTAAARRRRKNPGALTVYGLLNPQRKTMKRRKTNPKRKATTRRRRNPVSVVSLKKRTTRRHRNPSIARASITSVKMGVYALLGLVATRQLPQMLLKDKNTGVWGYLANLAAMLAASMAASRTMGKEAGTAVGVGGGLYIANRILSEHFSPIGKALSLSGVGDAVAATPAQLGAIRPAYWNHPPVTDRQGVAQLPPPIVEAIDARLKAVPPASQMKGYRMGR